MRPCESMQTPVFQSTLPVWGGTTAASEFVHQGCISIHPPRVGRDFQGLPAFGLRRLISIHPPRVGRDGDVVAVQAPAVISIHPPRVGRDSRELEEQAQQVQISIHPPRVGRDSATKWSRAKNEYFNPPSPCGEGRSALEPGAVPAGISIHPPRVGRDPQDAPVSMIWDIFQSTLPVWGGTNPCSLTFDFAPFQSTLPVWGGTRVVTLQAVTMVISIHPPRVGRDPLTHTRPKVPRIFQSTLPVWGGTAKAHKNSL